MTKKNKDLEDRYHYNYSSYNFDEKDKSGRWLSYFKMLRTSEYNMLICFVALILVFFIGWIGIEVYQALNSEGVHTLKDSFNGSNSVGELPSKEEGVE